MAFLSKLIPLFIYPLGLAIILVITAIFLTKRTRLQRFILIAAVLILWLASIRWTAVFLTRPLEWRYLPPEKIPQTQVIVVLGGGTEPQQFPRSSVEINSAGDRVIYAVQLYRKGAAPHILLSGGGLPWLTQDSQPAAEMQGLLELMGVPAEDIWLESESVNTHQNAVFSRKFLEPKGITDILLVSSASHMPRAVALFEAQGFNVTPVPVDYTVTDQNWRQLWEANPYTQILNLIPSASNLSLTTRSLKEYLGMVYYTLRGLR